MDMTITTQTLDNEALAVGNLQTGWQIKSWHHETALKRAAWQFLFSHPGSGWDEVGRGSALDRLLPAEVVQQRNMPADLIYSWTGKVL